MTRANRIRVLIVIGLVVVMASAIGARLYQLQVRHCERFRARAESQHQREFEVQATRGAILDRNGREPAVRLKTQSLFAHPWKVENPQHAAELLAPVLGLSRHELMQRLRSDKPFVYLRRFLDPEMAQAVRGLELPLGNGEPFGFQTEPKRYYPRGKLAVHVVGYATIDGDGVEGVEQRFDSVLQGDPTVYLALQDARNGQLRQLARAPERESFDVVLSIDIVLQHIVERELDRAMRETGAREASVILLDPNTGQIFALANRPAAALDRYAEATDAERLNRAVVSMYEPGSTFKIVPMAGALERNRLRPNEGVYCEKGTFRVGRRTIRDVASYKTLTARQVMAKSSNIGMVKITRKLQRQELWETIDRFGFGKETGIELPGECAGSLQPVSSWSGLSQDSLAFGQEIGVTALQMATAIAAVANDGVRVPPRVVLGTRGPDGRLLRFTPPRAEKVLDPRVARELQRMLEEVVKSGTGTRAAVPGYRIAGKSGTAQVALAGGYSDSSYVASFGGFGPVSGPRVAGLVVLHSPAGDRYHGGEVAGPIFGRIMSGALRHLRVPADPAIRTEPFARQAAARRSEN
jgi:cell division protein FtsI (penicillin-binding protein 3)